MIRHGATLIEMACVIVVCAMVLDVGARVIALVAPLLRAERGVPLARLEMACDRLRLDAALGVHLTGHQLTAGAHVWQVEQGMLCRDHAHLLRVTEASWREDAGHVQVSISAPGQPAHRLELWP